VSEEDEQNRMGNGSWFFWAVIEFRSGAALIGHLLAFVFCCMLDLVEVFCNYCDIFIFISPQDSEVFSHHHDK
jgi:hypothetical protein